MGNKKWFLPLPAAWPSSEDQWMHCAQSQPEQTAHNYLIMVININYRNMIIEINYNFFNTVKTMREIQGHESQTSLILKRYEKYIWKDIKKG